MSRPTQQLPSLQRQPARTHAWGSVLCALLLGVSASVTSWAASPLWETHGTPGASLAPNAGSNLAPSAKPGVSVERAVRIVRARTGGRVLAARAVNRGGRVGVNVRTLLDGERVTTFFVNADGRIQKP